eukprot:5330163-Pyramimonas_sp.AAC.2
MHANTHRALINTNRRTGDPGRGGTRHKAPRWAAGRSGLMRPTRFCWAVALYLRPPLYPTPVTNINNKRFIRPFPTGEFDASPNSFATSDMRNERRATNRTELRLDRTFEGGLPYCAN